MAGSCEIVLDVETKPHPEDRQGGEYSAAARALEAMKPEGADYGWTALNPWLATVTCVGMVHVEKDKAKAQTGPEGLILQVAADSLKKATKVVTFNGRSFDIPLLIHRMAIHGLQVPSTLRRAAQEPRYKLDASFDVREAMTFTGAIRIAGSSLRALCLAYGIDDPKAAGAGKESMELTPAELEAYCLGDVRATLELYRRWKLAAMAD